MTFGKLMLFLLSANVIGMLIGSSCNTQDKLNAWEKKKHVRVQIGQVEIIKTSH